MSATEAQQKALFAHESLMRQRLLYTLYHDKTPTALESAVEATSRPVV